MNSTLSPPSCLPVMPVFQAVEHNCHRRLKYGGITQHKFGGGQHSLVLPRLASIMSYHVSNSRSTCRVATPANEGTVSVVDFDELIEKDWSFLEPVDNNSEQQHKQKIDQIISAGEIAETSKVLISISSEHFVDRIVECSPCQQLLVVHDSLFTLACIKEKYDNVKCWQGEMLYLPEDWVALDVVFLYFLPALPFQLTQILETLSKHCLPGARIVISHPSGRQMVQEQKKRHPDIVVGDELPGKITLQDVATDNSFQLVKFVDEPDFYLAVLKLAKNG
ncbi:OLC1v1038150C1 [Oldenlandia corymbosa var. corymbosa]|uniref:OLC1v1038150C1 n=1 Tax=Oldenlandia corymbosa var. corymbosa TaxID=529605 RepID=A0AAV1D1T9_OLDCO|nr:OLC1v1038150C1 [Oldenlandia corymbosa var. corymbosa]